MSDLKIMTADIEEEALRQVNELAALPAFSESKIRIMPDVHAGKGCVIGFTGLLGEKVIPDIVGVDIGCGVVLQKTNAKEADLAAFDAYVKKSIPAGFCLNASPAAFFPEAESLLCWPAIRHREQVQLSLGTLGGGNHYIELDRGSDGFLWINVHTGSRNLGLQVATVYQRKAIENLRSPAAETREAQAKLAERLKQEGRSAEIGAALKELRASTEDRSVPDELCWLSGKDAEDYLHDMRICQRFAVLNRKAICDRLAAFFGGGAQERIETVHNYIDGSGMVRKGAVSAHSGERLAIPLNMRDGVLICTGLGNPDWNESAPHGAGRLMSRSQAKSRLRDEDFADAMKGIYTTTACRATIDEAPMAYKPASEIISLIGETVRIDETLRPAYSFKAAEDARPRWGKK